jgi:hypothetical protein
MTRQISCMAHVCNQVLCLALCIFVVVQAAFDIGFTDDNDLTSFVTVCPTGYYQITRFAS